MLTPHQKRLTEKSHERASAKTWSAMLLVKVLGPGVAPNHQYKYFDTLMFFRVNDSYFYRTVRREGKKTITFNG